MAKNKERLDHAIHNESVCNYLNLNQQYSDWIITTAFYSALQFAAYKVFPFTVPAIGGKSTQINNIDEFYRYKNDRKFSKHDLLSDLLDQHCPSVSADYDWLLDMSMTARYKSYQHDPLIAQRAITLMKAIKKECIK